MRYMAGLGKERLFSRCLFIALLLCLQAAAQAVERIYYHVNDPSGSPVMVVDAEGAVVARYAYAPFGSQQAAQPAAKQHLGFVGGIRETPGLHYLKHRYYNPQLGRFYQPDPVGFLQGGISQINRYAYGLNDPYTHQDKDGRCLPLCLYGAAVAMAPEEMATLTIGCARFCGPFLSFVKGLFNPGAPSVAGFAESRLATSVKVANAEIGPATRAISSDTGSLIGSARLSMQLSAEQAAGARMPIQITGYSKHALDQMAGRDGGVGVSQSALLDAWARPLKVSYVPSMYGPTFKLTGSDATIVVNADGKVVTGWATSLLGVKQ